MKQAWMVNTLEPERIFLAMKGYTVASLATATMAHRYAVILSPISDVST